VVLHKAILDNLAFVYKEDNILRLMNFKVFCLTIIALHVTRFCSEWIHWHYCSKSFVMSIITIQSPVCQGLRSLTDASGLRVVGTISRALALVANMQP